MSTGDILFEGLSGLGQQFDQQREQRERQREQLKTEAQKTEYLRKLISLENPDMADATRIMGGPELQAVHDAFTGRRLAEKQEMESEVVRAKLQQLADARAQGEAFSKAFQQAGTQTATLPGNVTNAIDPGSSPLLGAAMPDSTLSVNSMPTREELIAAMAGNPGSEQSPAGLALLEQAMKGGGDNTLAIGSVLELPGIGRMVGTGGAPQLIQDKDPGLALGQEMKLAGGGRLVGTGGSPHFVADADKAKALTEQQANALQFSERLAYNNAILLGLESKGFDPASMGTRLKNFGPNITKTSEFQQYEAAKRNWISAVLRKESGATITKEEMTSADAQYFPQMGDSKEVMQQKAQLRELAQDNMSRAVGDIPRAPSQTGAPPSRFDSETAARGAGHQAGDIIELYDPASASYRKARLK